MTTISKCRPAPELPEEIKWELLVAHMVIMEQHLGATNPLFEEDHYMALMEGLSEVYCKMNQHKEGWRVVVESAV